MADTFKKLFGAGKRKVGGAVGLSIGDVSLVADNPAVATDEAPQGIGLAREHKAHKGFTTTPSHSSKSFRQLLHLSHGRDVTAAECKGQEALGLFFKAQLHFSSFTFLQPKEEGPVTKERVLSKLTKLFKTSTVPVVLVHYSGPSDEHGNWQFGPSPKVPEPADATCQVGSVVSFREVSSLWQQHRKHSQRLVLLLDCGHSGYWAAGLRALTKAEQLELSLGVQASDCMQLGQEPHSMAAYPPGLFTKCFIRNNQWGISAQARKSPTKQHNQDWLPGMRPSCYATWLSNSLSDYGIPLRLYQASADGQQAVTGSPSQHGHQPEAPRSPMYADHRLSGSFALSAQSQGMVCSSRTDSWVQRGNRAMPIRFSLDQTESPIHRSLGAPAPRSRMASIDEPRALSNSAAEFPVTAGEHAPGEPPVDGPGHCTSATCSAISSSPFSRLQPEALQAIVADTSAQCNAHVDTWSGQAQVEGPAEEAGGAEPEAREARYSASGRGAFDEQLYERLEQERGKQRRKQRRNVLMGEEEDDNVLDDDDAASDTCSVISLPSMMLPPGIKEQGGLGTSALNSPQLSVNLGSSFAARAEGYSNSVGTPASSRLQQASFSHALNDLPAVRSKKLSLQNLLSVSADSTPSRSMRASEDAVSTDATDDGLESASQTNSPFGQSPGLDTFLRKSSTHFKPGTPGALLKFALMQQVNLPDSDVESVDSTPLAAHRRPGRFEITGSQSSSFIFDDDHDRYLMLKELKEAGVDMSGSEDGTDSQLSTMDSDCCGHAVEDVESLQGLKPLPAAERRTPSNEKLMMLVSLDMESPKTAA